MKARLKARIRELYDSPPMPTSPFLTPASRAGKGCPCRLCWLVSRTRQRAFSSLFVAGSVQRLGLHQPAFQIPDAVLVAGVCGGEFASLSAADSLHALPKMNGLTWIVSGRR